MFEGTLLEYITAFGGGTITLHLLKTWDDSRKGRLEKKQLEARALEMAQTKAASFLTRGRLWEVVAYRINVIAIKHGASGEEIQEFPPSMDAPYPELEPSRSDKI